MQSHQLCTICVWLNFSASNQLIWLPSEFISDCSNHTPCWQLIFTPVQSINQASAESLSLSEGWTWISAFWYAASYWSLVALLKKPHWGRSKGDQWLRMTNWRSGSHDLFQKNNREIHFVQETTLSGFIKAASPDNNQMFLKPKQNLDIRTIYTVKYKMVTLKCRWMQTKACTILACLNLNTTEYFNCCEL